MSRIQSTLIVAAMVVALIIAVMVVALIIAIGAVPTTAIVELDQAQETVDELFRS